MQTDSSKRAADVKSATRHHGLPIRLPHGDTCEGQPERGLAAAENRIADHLAGEGDVVYIVESMRPWFLLHAAGSDSRLRALVGKRRAREAA